MTEDELNQILSKLAASMPLTDEECVDLTNEVYRLRDSDAAWRMAVSDEQPTWECTRRSVICGILARRDVLMQQKKGTSMSSRADLSLREMTIREWAAIELHVPESGDETIDAMIRQSLRQDFAKAAMQGLLISTFNDVPNETRSDLEKAKAYLSAMLKSSIEVADFLAIKLAAAKENGNVTD